MKKLSILDCSNCNFIGNIIEPLNGVGGGGGGGAISLA
jgi:hypothetical protein